LFIGGPKAGPWSAGLYTVVASAMRHHLDVFAYLNDILPQLAVGAADYDCTPLLPDVWAKTHPEHVRSYRQREQERAAKARHQVWERQRAAASAAAASAAASAQQSATTAQTAT
jgi:hypothetical protein